MKFIPQKIFYSLIIEDPVVNGIRGDEVVIKIEDDINPESTSRFQQVIQDPTMLSRNLPGLTSCGQCTLRCEIICILG